MNNQHIGNHEPAYNHYKISIRESLLYFLIVVFLGQFIAGIVSSLTLIVLPSFNVVIMPLSFLLGFGVVAITLLKIKGMGLGDVSGFMQIPMKPMHTLIGVCIYIFCLPFAEYLSNIVPVDAHPLLEKLYEFFSESMQIILKEKVAAFLMVCILAPVLEEFIFRGFILRGLLQNNVNPWLAIMLTGFLFGAAHMNPWQFFGAGFLGIIFGFVYWRTQSLWLVMFLHFLNNLIAFLITIDSGTLEETVFDANPFLILGGIVIALISGYYLYNITKKTYLKQTTES